MDWYADHFGEIRVPHKGDIVGQVIEGAYEVMGIFDKVTENMESMKSVILNQDEQYLFGKAALTVRYEDENKIPVSPEQIITPRRREDKQNDLWTTYQRVQEKLNSFVNVSYNNISKAPKNFRGFTYVIIPGHCQIVCNIPF